MSQERNIAVDMFSGTGSATAPFRESPDWKVIDIELNERDEIDFDSERIELEKSIMEVRPDELPSTVDFVWASPPCTTFSTASMGHYWTEYLPEKQKTVDHVAYVYRALWLINQLNPTYWFLENPRAFLRNVMPVQPTGTVTYCQYGSEDQKPTDLYGKHPPSMTYRKCTRGSTCHNSAPRGENHQGTQASDKDAIERSKVPRELAEQDFQAVENPGKSERQSKISEVHSP